MHSLKGSPGRRLTAERCHLRMTYLMLMTSAASVVMCYSNNVTSFKPLRKLGLMPIDFRPHYTQLYQVEKLKAQILRGLNLTSVPEPPKKKPPQPVRVFSHLAVPSYHSRQTDSAIVWSEPVDAKKELSDRLLFRISNQRKKSSSINRVSLLLRLRSSRHSKRKQGKRPRARKNRRKLSAIKGKGIQNDQQNRPSRRKSSSARKSKSRRRKSRRVKVLVQTMNGKSGKFKRVAVQRVVVDKKFHWVRLPIPAAVVSRAVSSNQSLVMRVRCKRCQKGGVSIDSAVPRKKSRRKDVGFSNDLALNPNRPYLVIIASKSADASPTGAAAAAAAAAAPSRSARHVRGACPQASNDVTPCCAQRVYVSFRDLGWDDWLVYPAGFSTVMCRGVCHRPSGGSEGAQGPHHGGGEASNQTGLIPHTGRTRSSKQRAADAPSDGDGGGHGSESGGCQPQDLNPLAVLYYADPYTLIHSHIPDLVGNACACV